MAASNVAQLVILFITALTFTYSLLRLSIQVKQNIALKKPRFQTSAASARG